MNLTSKLVILFTLFACTTTVAQEYKYEVGGFAGMSMYMGDANPNLPFHSGNFSTGLVFRSNLDFRWAIKADLLYGKITGDTKNVENVFPNRIQATFKRNFFELDGQMEFNFLPYSDKFAFLNTSKISPYILFGCGLTVAPGINQTFLGLNIPIGIGVKYKIHNRWNIGLEYSVHKLFDDGFDAPYKNGFNLDNPYNIQSGLLKNKDWYNTLFLSITWEFGLRDGRCTTN